MLSIFEDILCIISGLASIIEYAAVVVVNDLIIGLAAVLAVVAPLLPSMPSFPDLSGQNFAWLGWLVPVSSIVGLNSLAVTIFLTMFGLRIALRWVKAL